MKQCRACGQSYTPFTWITLPYVGTYYDPDPEYPDIELRNCGCGSTLANPLPMSIKDVRRLVQSASPEVTEAHRVVNEPSREFYEAWAKNRSFYQKINKS